MDKNTVNMFLTNYTKYFEADKLIIIREKMLQMDEDKFMALTAMMGDLKDPTVSLICSIFLGYLGIDRFLIGDVGMGVLKLLTAGGCMILAFMDIFLISSRTKEKNFEKIQNLLLIN